MWRNHDCPATDTAYHYRAQPVEVLLLQKFQTGKDSDAESKMCPTVYAISKCYKGATGVQICVWHSRSFSVPKYEEMVLKA
jgi:hypothetical protein